MVREQRRRGQKSSHECGAFLRDYFRMQIYGGAVATFQPPPLRTGLWLRPRGRRQLPGEQLLQCVGHAADANRRRFVGSIVSTGASTSMLLTPIVQRNIASATTTGTYVSSLSLPAGWYRAQYSINVGTLPPSAKITSTLLRNGTALSDATASDSNMPRPSPRVLRRQWHNRRTSGRQLWTGDRGGCVKAQQTILECTCRFMWMMYLYAVCAKKTITVKRAVSQDPFTPLQLLLVVKLSAFFCPALPVLLGLVLCPSLFVFTQPPVFPRLVPVLFLHLLVALVSTLVTGLTLTLTLTLRGHVWNKSLQGCVIHRIGCSGIGSSTVGAVSVDRRRFSNHSLLGDGDLPAVMPVLRYAVGSKVGVGSTEDVEVVGVERRVVNSVRNDVFGGVGARAAIAVIVVADDGVVLSGYVTGQ